VEVLEVWEITLVAVELEDTLEASSHRFQGQLTLQPLELEAQLALLNGNAVPADLTRFSIALHQLAVVAVVDTSL
jgi:hypothetical protein